MTTDLTKVLSGIKKINEEKKKGIVHFLPFPDRMSRLGKVLGHVGKEDYFLISAASGVGKSTFMYDMVQNYAREFLDTYDENIDMKITVFVNILEESVSSLLLRSIVAKLSEKGIDLSVRDLNGRRLESIDNKIMSVVEDSVQELEVERVSYSDRFNIHWSDIGNPFGFYNLVRDYFAKNGTYYNDKGQKIPLIKDKNGMLRPKDIYGKYVPNDSKELVIVVSDHLKLYSSESGKSWRDTIEYFSQIYCRRILNLHYGAAVINVQQQASASEAIIFDRNGKPIIPNTYPTTQNLGDITTTQRDATHILGIWNPHKYSVEKEVVGGITYDYAAFQRKGMPIRIIFPLKNRGGPGEGSKLICWVDFKTRKFYQLPKTQSEVDALLNN